jgi:hypothetical protein
MIYPLVAWLHTGATYATIYGWIMKLQLRWSMNTSLLLALAILISNIWLYKSGINVVTSSCTTFLGLSTPAIKLPRHLVGLFIHNMDRGPWDNTNQSSLSFHSSVCNILTGIHFSSCVDGLDSGRVLLHPNPVFCQSSHEWMSWPIGDIIWPSHEKPSRDSNISTLKGLSINKCFVVSWCRMDKTTKQH